MRGQGRTYYYHRGMSKADIGQTVETDSHVYITELDLSMGKILEEFFEEEVISEQEREETLGTIMGLTKVEVGQGQDQEHIQIDRIRCFRCIV